MSTVDSCATPICPGSDMSQPAPERPEDATALGALIGDATLAGRPLELRGGGSHAHIGRPERATTLVDMRAFAGIVDHDAAEFVLSAGAATPLADVEAQIAAHDQMLAFEPYAAGPHATLGGVIGAGVAGSRRLSAGGARDHLLGFEAISGRGERFIAGGRVVKNVTGYDLSKLMAGSWGRLAALTRVTLRLLPRPACRATLVLHGLDAATAVAAMGTALRAPLAVAAAAHLPAGIGDGGARTLLRLEGFAVSVASRLDSLRALLPASSAADVAHDAHCAALWQPLQGGRLLDQSPALWRIVLPPAAGARAGAALAPFSCGHYHDWAGGLLWLATSCSVDAARLRAIVEAHGGRAMLVRGDAAMRATVPILHPEPAALAALGARVRAAFDPASILDPQRF